MQDSMCVGLDVHKATISIAVARGEWSGEVRHWGTVPQRPDHVRRLVEIGHDCIVVAPSLIPVKAGDRMKTNRRDAMVLAKLHRAGELTAVWVAEGS